jgi:hypothetical protein
MLAASVLFERSQAPGCWQTSISAYYYTPGRPVLIGVLLAIGLSLIVIKGRKWEDFFLNLGGMLAPVVALVPTSDVGTCASARETSDADAPAGELAPWILDGVRNNVWALLVTGLLALVLVVLVSERRTGSVRAAATPTDRAGRVTISLFLTILLVIGGVGLYLWTDWFEGYAHGTAAVVMFFFLFVVVFINWRRKTVRYPVLYGVVAAGMAISVPVSFLFGNHQLLALEVLEIGWFAVFWMAQTVEGWQPFTTARAQEAPSP